MFESVNNKRCPQDLMLTTSVPTTVETSGFLGRVLVPQT